jgi:hypothetical protein
MAVMAKNEGKYKRRCLTVPSRGGKFSCFIPIGEMIWIHARISHLMLTSSH